MTEKERIVRLNLAQRKTAYQQTFNAESVAVKAVLRDLSNFCRAYTTTFHPDPRMHSLLEGRREVFLRIEQHLKLTHDELFALLR